MGLTLSDRERFALALFLIGGAALAVFNWWFPGILWVLGLSVWVDGRYRRVAVGLLIVGAVYTLRDITSGLPSFIFPVLLVGLALVVLWWDKLTKRE